MNSPSYGNPTLVLPIAMVINIDKCYGPGIVLHPDYPALEPIVGKKISSFGRRFGVPFKSSDGQWFC